MDNGSARLLRKSINDHHALDVRYMSLLVLIMFPVSIYFEGGKGLPRHDLKIWILAIVLGWLAMLTYLICLRFWWVTRQRPTLSLSFLLFLSGSGGAIHGLVVGLIVGFFEVYLPDSFLHRIAMSFISSLCWLPINAFLVSSVLSFGDAREDLHQEVETLRAISFRQNGLAQRVRKVVEDEVIKELKWSRVLAQKRFQSSIESDMEHGINPQLLKSYAGEELRTMSHNLWSKSRGKAPSNMARDKGAIKSIWELFQVGLRLPPYDIRVYFFIYASAIIPILTTHSNSPMELLSAVFVLICFYLLMLAGEKLYNRFQRFSPQIFTLRTAIAVYLPFFLLSLVNPRAEFWKHPHPISFKVSTFLLTSFIIFVLTLSKAAIYSQKKLIAALERATDSQKAQVNLASDEIAAVSRQWAQYIHGNLQSRLLAAAAVLERSNDEIDIGLKELATAEATKIMSGDFEALGFANRSLTEEVYFQVERWKDLIDIEINCLIAKDPDWLPTNQFGALVEEAVSNAFRHGHATKVVISIHLNNDGWLECNFTDNGVGGASNHPSGLGSSVFDSVARGNWSLRPGPDGNGTCLHMIIPALELPPARGGSSVG